MGCQGPDSTIWLGNPKDIEKWGRIVRFGLIGCKILDILWKCDKSEKSRIMARIVKWQIQPAGVNNTKMDGFAGSCLGPRNCKTTCMLGPDPRFEKMGSQEEIQLKLAWNQLSFRNLARLRNPAFFLYLLSFFVFLLCFFISILEPWLSWGR